MKRVTYLLVISLIVSGFVLYGTGSAQNNGNPQSRGAASSRAVAHGVSVPVAAMPLFQPDRNERPHEHPVKPLPLTAGQTGNVSDTALQTTPGPQVATAGVTSFDGVGIPNYNVNAAPPDTNGAVGADAPAGAGQYVQWVNEAFAVYRKSDGVLLKGPVAGNSLWAGFAGGKCSTNNDGDPIAQYDKINNRWIMTQFSVTGGPPYYQCVAVSQTPDALGAYNLYAFQYSDFNDYPKLGVWPDGYYVTYNMFRGGTTFSGGMVCALDAAAMRAGTAATQQCFNLGTSYGGLLPADLDGSIQPPAGSPEFVLNFGTNNLHLWKFHVDWANSANSTLTGPTTLSVASFSTACSGGSCIAQPGTATKLDSLGDRLMYRLAYRNFADGHESLVVNHSVQLGTNKRSQYTGVRWYELRSPNGTPTVYQSGTFAPDTAYRWMGSAAMDKLGDIVMGYSVSSSSIYPSIRFTARLASDPLGTMGTESSIYGGSGSQNANLNRWGDYSSLSVDPTDDCSMWYTTEYLQSTGSFNWSTRVGHFKLANCQ